jgi:hypothetical protein
MERMVFRGEPAVVDLTSDKKIASKVRNAQYY